MTHELEPRDRWRARAVYAPLDHSLALESIIRGLTPASIHVDDPRRPRAALTWFKSRAWLAGDPDKIDAAPFRSLLEGYADQLRSRGATAYVLHHAPYAWEGCLDELLGPLNRRRARRLYYRLDASTRSWETEAPEGYTLAPVDGELLRRTHLRNLDAVMREMASERPSVQDFLERSLGCCAISGDEIASWCMTEYNAGNRCELGIATAEGHRRRGLATLTGSATIAWALREGINEIGWHCWADNAPSIASAEGLGFTQGGEHTVQVVRL
jgi:RimJ/RimL family protein N-acetyltransferase